VCKGAHALGLLKEVDEKYLDAEDDLLAELLAQKRWRRGRRGQWWDRRITLAMKNKYKNKDGYQRALRIVAEALTDPDTRLCESSLAQSCSVSASDCVSSAETQVRPAFDQAGEECGNP
jgi:hypothetical protein